MHCMNGTGSDNLKISPRDILFILFFKRHVAIGVFLIVVALVLVKTLTAEPVYQVQSALLIKPLVDSRLQLHSNRFMVDPVSEYDVNSEIKIMASKELMKRVVHKLGILKKQKAKKT
ncbi:MAG: hypothetical protein D3924_04885, partial [Candidatus Electrothrix sp. AR4]|nr:hypothetical protein [Candidatus Electrothrix sp. AR4]